ncbi:MAG: OmpH family outer membrane protein [Saprospiraceae bacterium]|nr:OmpH family outer membrane protein [Saprospiraceae bacterium]
MNRHLKYIVTIALLAGTFVLASAQTKIGYVNSVALLQEIPEVKQANANLEALQTQLQKKGQSMVEEFQKKYQELQRKEQQGELSPKMLQDEGAKLQEEEKKIQQYEQDMQTQLAEKQQTLLQPILDKVNGFIEEIAKEDGLSYVIDSSSGVLLYADETMDITAKVKARLGM